MMATAASGPGKGPLLNLTFLTPEERAKIESVLKADEALRIRDRVRVGTLRQELEKERYFQKQLLDKPQCTCCERKLGSIFGTGAPCPGCMYLICKQCRVISHKPPPPFLCPVCVKKRLVDLQAADYTSVPSANFSPSPLFGSQLVMMSLEAEQKRELTMINPYDGKAKKRLITNLSQQAKPRSASTATNSSSIVVRYEEQERSPSVLSGRSDSGSTNGQRDRPNTLPPARKISPSELSDSEDEENEGRLEVPGVSRLVKSESISSIGSLTSMYSAAGGKGDYAISGEVFFGVWYSREGLLKIYIDQARNLAATRKEGYSYPYVKVYLLPDHSKQTKRKTGFRRRTVSPKYDETLKYKLAESELSSRTLWLSIWDWDRFGRNQFLGEVRLPLKSLDLTDNKSHWHTLLDQDESAQLEAESQYRGRLRLGLMFESDPENSNPLLSERKKRRQKGILHVAIKEAEDLPEMDPVSLTDAVVKCYLLPSRTASNKRKTEVVKSSLSPVWNEAFIYKTSLKELLGDRVLEVTIWDYDKRGSNDFIGGLHLGPTPSETTRHKEWMDSIGEEAAHWETMLARPGEWVEQWHTLRPRMDRVTTLPQKPASLGRELSPVQETLSPLSEQEREDDNFSSRTNSLSSPHASGDAALQLRSLTFPRKGSARSQNETQKSSSLDLSHVRQNQASQSKTKPPVHRSALDIPRLGSLSPSPEGTQQSRSSSPVPELLVTSGATRIPRSTSTSSIKSTFSDGEMARGDYDITGDIQLGLTFRSGQLLIHLNRARELASADSSGFSDPYVKTYLLPDHSKHSKRKTKVQRKTLNPIFDETLEYSVDESDLLSRTLWLSLWDWDRFGRNQFLGEVRLPLKSLDLQSDTELWYTLLDKDQPYVLTPNRGQIDLFLKFVPKESKGGVTRGTLSVIVKRACNLSFGEESGKPHPFVECCLLPDDSARRKTTVIKDMSSPSWKETFLFEKVTLEEIVTERVLEVTVWNSNEGGSNDFIGGLRLGPTPSGTTRQKEWMDSIGEEAAHWEAMLARPGEWAEQWHTLRSSMEPRSIDFSIFKKSNGGLSQTSPALSIDDDFRKVGNKSGTKSGSSSPQYSPIVSVRSRTRPPLQPTSSVFDDEEQQPRLQRSSPVLTRASHKLMTGKKPVENRFTEPVSSSKLPRSSRSESPLTSLRSHPSGSHVSPNPPPVGDISRPKDPLRSKSSSPEVPVSQEPTPHGTLERPTPHGTLERPSSRNTLERPSSRSTLERPSSQNTLERPPPGPLKRAGLLGVQYGGSHSSLGSQLSIYSAAGGGKGEYDIIGEVLVGISYRQGQLMVHVDSARNLAAADSNGFSDPYVKTYLLPDHSKHSKRKTDIKRKTLNPSYNQTLVYKLAESELPSRTLWLSVWDWDRFGRNQFLGEVRLPLQSLDLTDTTDHWHTLMDKDDDPEGVDYYRGQLKLALRFSPMDTKKGKTRGVLQVIIRQGREFPSTGTSGGKPDPVVKCYLLPDKSSSGKRKVAVIKNQSNPVWDEQFSYEKVILEDIVKERVLEVTVWDWDKKGSSFIGGLRLGPTPSGTTRQKEWMDSIGDEAAHWETMLAQPGEWVEQWHTLRTTMDPRSIAIQ